MSDILVLGAMSLCALIPFALATRWVEVGRAGYALSLIAVSGAVLSVLMFATSRDFGIDPVQAMTGALLFALPATLGACAGGLLGWLIRRRQDQRLQK